MKNRKKWTLEVGNCIKKCVGVKENFFATKETIENVHFSAFCWTVLGSYVEGFVRTIVKITRTFVFVELLDIIRPGPTGSIFSLHCCFTSLHFAALCVHFSTYSYSSVLVPVTPTGGWGRKFCEQHADRIAHRWR